uniref:Rab-GAP TBC domain-containing protein n=1 Tax=Oryza meridionalis TaxID=40149 RepID=A0A0E0F754_9ORYZ
MLRRAGKGEVADGFYQIRSDCTHKVPETKFKIKVGKTLSVRKWHAAFTREGRLDIASVLNRIQKGGVHPTIRGEVWEFLLGCFDPGSTFDEREQIREKRSLNIVTDDLCRIQYAIWKQECKDMDSHVGSGKIITAPIITEDGKPIKDPLVLLEATSDQHTMQGSSSSSRNENEVDKSENCVVDKQIIEWKLLLHQIGLDVLRTDRSMVFYENKENLSKLWDILAVYAWIDKEIGYCQETLGGGDYLFAFRMFMVLFRRELSFGDSLYLWEMMWALEYDPDIFSTYEHIDAATGVTPGHRQKVKSIHQFGKYERDNMKNRATSDNDGPVPISVFLVASVLKENSAKLLQEARGIDDVIRILNDVNGNLDAKKACAVALKLHRKYLKKIQGKKP